ncbi:mitochondrial translation elongation factor Tu 2 [Arctopsyche grandis]|uniref:mitochondrial translation elongation factor Tu 2 n=1 Tax=Arctopsyche grandis TaxID=121162 RepID=UPI00406D702D
MLKMLPVRLIKLIRHDLFQHVTVRCRRKVTFSEFCPSSMLEKQTKIQLLPQIKYKSTLPEEDESSIVNHCNIGTIGHIDHGKTSLTAAITKVLEKDGYAQYISYDNIDKTKEERERGITINASHIGYSTANRHYAHTDCPGHSDFIRNMISGASQMDGAIAVIAADDGQMPQTVEHLLLTKQLGVEKLVVFINKADLVDSDVLELIEIEIRELLSDFGFDGIETPVVVGSAMLALKGDTSKFGEPSIRKLLHEIDNYIPTPVRDLDAPFVMPIDNSFTIPGRGSVVVGTLKKGIINKNDRVNLMGFGHMIKTTISDIQIFKKSVPNAEAGDNVGILLRNIKLKEIQRGMVLCAENSANLSNRYKAEFYLLSKQEGGRSKPIKSKAYIQQLFSTTWDITCRIDLSSGREMLLPGEHSTVELTLLQGMVLPIGQRFTIRENNVTVGTGCVIDVLPSVNIPKSGDLVNININQN